MFACFRRLELVGPLLKAAKSLTVFIINIVTASCEVYKHSVWADERNTFYETRHLAVRMPRHLALLAGKILEGRERRKGQVTEQHQIRVLTSKGKPYYLIILFWILWFCLGFCDCLIVPIGHGKIQTKMKTNSSQLPDLF